MGIWIPAAHHWVGREGQVPRYLILHGTAGGQSAQGIADFFALPSTQASAHYVIGLDGTVVQCVQEQDAAWSNGGITGPPGQAGDGIHHDAFWDTGINPNLVTIAIEHVKPSTDNSDQLTEPQKQASFALVEDICARWHIPARWADAGGGITGHFSLDPVNRSRCPGPYPFDELFAYLTAHGQPAQGEQNAMLTITDTFAATFFKAVAADRWHCVPTDKDIFGGILTFYRQILGAPRLPVTGENYTILGVVWQQFEAGIIVYDPQRKLDNPPGFTPAYLLQLNTDLARQILDTVPKAQLDQASAAVAAANDRIAALQQQLAQLQGSRPDLTPLKTVLQSLQDAVQTVESILK